MNDSQLMAGLVPAIYVFSPVQPFEGVGTRDGRRHDERDTRSPHSQRVVASSSSCRGATQPPLVPSARCSFFQKGARVFR